MELFVAASATGSWSMPEGRVLAYDEVNAQSYARWLNDRVAMIERAGAAGERARDAGD